MVTAFRAYQLIELPSAIKALVAYVPLGVQELGSATAYSRRNLAPGTLTTSGALPQVPALLGNRARLEEATTNVYTNPIYGAATFDTGWTAESGLTKAQETVIIPSMPSGQTVANAAKLTADGSNRTWTQSLTLTVATYADSCLVHQAVGNGAVTSADMVLYDEGAAVTTTFTDVSAQYGAGWYRATGSFTGTAGAATHGVQVKAGKSVIVTCHQDELKAYATTPCAGSFGTGYAWTGSANASTSTRAISQAILPAIPAGVTPSSFGVAMWVRMLQPGTVSPVQQGRLLSWRDDSNNVVQITWISTSNGVINFQRISGGSTDQINPVVAWSAGADIFVVFGGDSAAIYGSINGAPSTVRASSNIPTLSATTIGLACRTDSFGAGDVDAGPIYIAPRPFTDQEIQYLYNSKRLVNGALPG